MILVIDAYNVVKQAHSAPHISESEKQQFIKELGWYAKKKGHAIIAVFDGGSGERPEKERMHGIQVVHTGIHQSADEWIKDYFMQHQTYDMLLVSTDRELNRFVARLAFQSLDAMDFYALMRQALKNAASYQPTSSNLVVKIQEESNPLLDVVMEHASQKILHKSEDVQPKKNDRSSNARQLSKKERQILRKLKKL